MLWCLRQDREGRETERSGAGVRPAAAAGRPPRRPGGGAWRARSRRVWREPFMSARPQVPAASIRHTGKCMVLEAFAAPEKSPQPTSSVLYCLPEVGRGKRMPAVRRAQGSSAPAGARHARARGNGGGGGERRCVRPQSRWEGLPAGCRQKATGGGPACAWAGAWCRTVPGLHTNGECRGKSGGSARRVT